jgi:hypothetical protein
MDFKMDWGLLFFLIFKKIFFREGAGRCMGAAAQRCRSLYHQNMLLKSFPMNEGFDNLIFLGSFCVPPLVTEVIISPK